MTVASSMLYHVRKSAHLAKSSTLLTLKDELVSRQQESYGFSLFLIKSMLKRLKKLFCHHFISFAFESALDLKWNNCGWCWDIQLLSTSHKKVLRHQYFRIKCQKLPFSMNIFRCLFILKPTSILLFLDFRRYKKWRSIHS